MGFSEFIGARENAKPGVCTSATRPASPYEGQMIFETDTNRTALFVDGKWSGAYQWTANTSATSYVTSGLTMYLDAGLTSSYPGTGTTWTDLSGNGNHATLVNSPTFNASRYGGSITFNGTNQSATTALLNQAPSNATLQTYSVWGVYLNDQYYFGSNAAGGGQYHFWVYLYSNQLSHLASNYGGGGAVDGNFYATVSPKNVNNITLVKTAPYYFDLYFNGYKVYSQLYRNATISTSLVLGQYYSGSFGRSENLIVQAYSRALSEAEVLQNYNAFAPRFGL